MEIIERIGPWIFTGIDPSVEITPIFEWIKQRVGFLPLDEFKAAPYLNRDYLINAHWALYCDNYLEGFHIPFVHHGLNEVLDYGSYRTEIFDHANLQIGYARSGDDAFELPKGHPDHGQNIGAYYFWLFPNMMLNFYPWGLSVNVVRPLSINKTKVSFILYVLDEAKLNSGAGAALDAGSGRAGVR